MNATARRSRVSKRAFLSLMVAMLVACGREESGDRWNVVLVTLDTTRADRISYVGHARPTSPVLDSLAAEGIAFTRAYSVSSWTAPSHASIFSGLYPSEHGCHADALAEEERPLPIRPDVRLISERLSEEGYACAGFTGGPYLDSSFGFDRGFDVWDDDLAEAGYRDAREVNDAAIPWLEERRGSSEPFFLFVNYFDPHGPYTPNPDIDYPFEAADPAESGERSVFGFSPVLVKGDVWSEPTTRETSAIVDLYDREIYAADAALENLLRALDAAGVRERTILVVVGDHGEAFGEVVREERTWGHGLDPYESQCRVPLVIVHPGAAPDAHAGVRRDRRVSSIHLAATILDAAGVEHDFPGHSLLTEGADASGSTEPIFAERYFPGRRVVGFWSDDFKLLRSREPDSEETFDRLCDIRSGSDARVLNVSSHERRNPDELPNDVRRAMAVTARIRSELEEFVAGRPELRGDFEPVEAAKLGSDLRSRLEALGYLDEAAGGSDGDSGGDDTSEKDDHE